MHVLVTTTDIQSIPLIVPAVGPPKIGTIADLALNPIVLQGDPSGRSKPSVDIDMKVAF